MPKKSRYCPQPSNTTSLALSSVHIRLEALDKEHRWLLKQIKRKRTELTNLVEQMRSVATDVYQRCYLHFQKIVDIDREIHTLFDEILTTRKLSKQSKKDIEEIYYELQISRLISFKTTNQPQEENSELELDEFFETNQEDDFSENHRQEKQILENYPSNKRSDTARKIRQTFLSLAEIFHPDKVKDGETKMLHTEIMKEVNKAYQEGDLARLLEIEQQYQAGKYIDINNADDLNCQCMQIEQQNKILKDQYDKLKQELRLVKNTPEGVMVSDCRKAARSGVNAIDSMVEQVECEVQIIAAIRDFVRDFREQKITMKQFVSGPMVMRERKQGSLDDWDGVILF